MEKFDVLFVVFLDGVFSGESYKLCKVYAFEILVSKKKKIIVDFAFDLDKGF